MRVSGKRSTTDTHRELLHLEYLRRYESLAESRPNRSANALLEGWVQHVPCAHIDRQRHTLDFVLRPALVDAYCVVDACGKHGALQHAVYLA